MKFGPDVCEGLVKLRQEGFTIKDAAFRMGVGEKTLKKWLGRGRKEKDGPHRDFFVAWEEATREAEQAETELTPEEFRIVVSKAARKGSVAAMKLYHELTKGDSPETPAGDDDSKPASDDPFSELDDEDEDT